MSLAPYEPQSYWQQRLCGDFNLVGVGHRGFSEYYNGYYYRSKRRALFRWLRRQRVSLSGCRVLDVGSGTGYFVELYRALGAEVVGLDISDVAVTRLRERFPMCRFARRDITSEPVEDLGRFDLVNVWEVLMHVVEDRRFSQALAHIAAVSAGWVLISDLLPPRPVSTAAHVRLRGYAEYAGALRAAGLEVREVVGVTHLLGPTFPGWRGLHRFLGAPAQRVLRRPADDLLAPLLYTLDGAATYRPWERCGDLKLLTAQRQR